MFLVHNSSTQNIGFTGGPVNRAITNKGLNPSAVTTSRKSIRKANGFFVLRRDLSQGLKNPGLK